jgi:hypothetical protein
MKDERRDFSSAFDSGPVGPARDTPDYPVNVELLNEWEGIHPRQWLFGWVVASPPASARFRRRYRCFTRQGAERLAKRLNRRKERQDRALIKSGILTGYDRFSVLGRIGEHPLRSSGRDSL